MRYQITFNSGRAECNCTTFIEAMKIASCCSEEFFIWETMTGQASKLIVHGWRAFGISE